MHPNPPRSTGLSVLALWSALACAVHAAPLPDTPDTLIEKMTLLRNSRDRVWDPATGQLGNLRQLQLVADGCTVRVVSGADNRVIGPLDGVSVSERRAEPRDGLPRPRDVDLHARPPRGGLPRGAVCMTLQLATPHSLVVSGDDAAVLFDRVQLPALRMYLNPSTRLRLWFHDVRLGMLRISSNANALVGGTGQAQWLTLDSSQASTAMFFHGTNARHVGVSSTTTGPRFSIRIAPGTWAGYYQPAAAPGNLAQRYPIWIDGPLSGLEQSAGRVNAMPLTPAIRAEADALRDEVLVRAGPPPMPPMPDVMAPAPAAAALVSPRQRVADAFRPYLPPGMDWTAVQLWKDGGAVEGTAPNKPAVAALVQALGRSPDVTHAQLAYTKPLGGQPAVVGPEGGPVSFRVMFHLACSAPGEPSACLPGSGGAYTEAQIRAELVPLLGPKVALTELQLRGQKLLLKGNALDTDTRAAWERIEQRAPWLRSSGRAVGPTSFSATLHLLCPAPPLPQGGVCGAPQPTRR